MVRCPPSKELQAYSRGQLSEEASDEMSIHLSSCPACQSHLETVSDAEDSIIASLRGVQIDDAYAHEAGYPIAMAQALAALAEADALTGDERATELPAVIGEYRIVRPLGHGGMGTVYLARHTKLGREVALKVLASKRLGNQRVQDRFEGEMQAIGRLSHPNIVAAYDARDVDGIAVLITEFIDGMNLGQLIHRLGPLPFEHASEIIRQVAHALEYTNNQGFVHRDIKPSNIMLSVKGEVKLLDLGLARIQLEQQEQHEMTGTGEAMGTADYMAPEQVSDSRSVDVRADIYSLGCTLFKLVTGAAPFSTDESAFAKMTSHVSKQPPTIADFCVNAPSALVTLVDSMLEKDVKKRPQTPRAVADTLNAIIGTGQSQNTQARLAELVAKARAVDSSTSASSTPNAMNTNPHEPSMLKSKPPIGVLIAIGLVGLICSFFLGVLVTIKYPDGTVTRMLLPAGSKLEIRTTDEKKPKSDSQKSASVATNGSVANGDVIASEDFVDFKLKYVSSYWMKLQLIEFFEDDNNEESTPANQRKLRFIDDGESILVVRNATPQQLATIRRLIGIYDTAETKPKSPHPIPSRTNEGPPTGTVEPATVSQTQIESRPPLQIVVLRNELPDSSPPDPALKKLGLAEPNATTRWIPLAPDVNVPTASVSSGESTFLPTVNGHEDVVRWADIVGHTSAMSRGGTMGTTITFDDTLTEKIDRLIHRHPEHSLGIVFNGEVIAILQSNGSFTGQLLLSYRLSSQELQYLMGSLSGHLVEGLPERNPLRRTENENVVSPSKPD